MTRTKYTILFTFVLLPLLIGLACETTTPTDLATTTPTPPAISPTPTILASTNVYDDERRPPSPTPTITTCTVTSLALNMRSGPGLDYPAIDWLSTGDVMTITNQIGQWLHAGDGWIKRDYCK